MNTSLVRVKYIYTSLSSQFVHWEKILGRVDAHFELLACPKINTHLLVKLTHFHVELINPTQF